MRVTRSSQLAPAPLLVNRFGLLAAGAAVVAVGAVLAAAALARPMSLAAGRSASAAAVSHSALRRCATFTVNKVVDGKLVRRNGTVVKVKHVQCVTVPAAACMVAWVKKRNRGV